MSDSTFKKATKEALRQTINPFRPSIDPNGKFVNVLLDAIERGVKAMKEAGEI